MFNWGRIQSEFHADWLVWKPKNMLPPQKKKRKRKEKKSKFLKLTRLLLKKEDS